MQNIADQFADTNIDLQKIQQLAEFIAIEDDALSKMAEQLQSRKDNLDKTKTDLAELMMQSGMRNCKLDNGLTPSVSVNTKFFKAQGVTDEQLHDWLRQNNLDGIIKETVHWGTLQSTMKEYVDSFGDVPEIINKSDVPSIRMNGKAKFIASRNQ